jgi:hypothetical protein
MIIISVSVLILGNVAQFNQLLPYFSPRVSLAFLYAADDAPSRRRDAWAPLAEPFHSMAGRSGEL